MKKILLDASLTRTGLHIVQTDDKLRAYTRCCVAAVHYSISEMWICARCNRGAGNGLLGTHGRSMYFLDGVTETKTVEEWISYCTGICKSDFEVTVEWAA